MRSATHRRPRHYRGSHCRPSPAARITAVTAATAGAVALAGLGLTASPAQATTVPVPTELHAVRLAGAVPKPAVLSYTVRPGDTLSSIAAHLYNDPAAWPVLYWANHRQIRWADDITAGQVLLVPAKPAKIPAAPGQLGPQPAAVTTVTVAVAQQSVSPGSYSGVQACIIARESGGNAQVMNATGHYGLYQFSAGTWAAYGGNPADFGNASVAEQNQVFNTAMSTPGGIDNWAPYDGC